MVSEEFSRLIQDQIRSALPAEYENARIWTEEILKDADRQLTGLCIRREGEEEFPRIYLEDYEQDYRNGMSLESILRSIRGQLEESRTWSDLRQRARDIARDPEKARQAVTLRIVNRGRNIQNITTRPHRDMGEFVAIYSLELGRGGRVPVDHKLAKKLELSEQELYDLSMKNSPVLTPVEILTVGQALGFPGDHPEDMLVISNPEHADGAVSLLYPGVDEEIRERLGGDYYVLPSSVHEVIAIPKTPERLDELEAMVRHVNASRVMANPADFLSDHVQEMKDGMLTRAMPEPERAVQKSAPIRFDPER